MSGTSLDGLDIAYCKFQFNTEWKYEIIHAETYDYSSDWKEILKNIHLSSAEEICSYDFKLGQYFGNRVTEFIEKNNIKKIDYVSSHGHTVFHKPPHYTLQIGNGASISSNCNLDVICDFRSKDVSLNGEGAPLVPIGDQLLFNNYDYCLNIGGITNISFNQNNTRKAFDICYANMLLNFLSNELGLEYDKGGTEASKGVIHQDLLKKLTSIDFENKSLGKELFEKKIVQVINQFEISTRDKLRTSIEYLALNVSKIIESNKSLFITGGGAKNDFFIKILKEKLPNNDIIIPNETLIDFKEALIFAFLGVLRIEKETNSLSSVTNASRDSIGGAIYSK